eukprot:98565_1
MAKDCDLDEPWKVSYAQMAIVISTSIIFHIILFTYILTKRAEWNKTKRSLATLFIVMQILAILWNVNELFRFVVVAKLNPQLPVHNAFFCNVSAFGSRLLIPWFYVTSINILLIRLHHSLHGSIYALSSTAFNILIAIPNILLISLPLIGLSLSPAPCIHYWSVDKVPYCYNDVYNSFLIVFVYIIYGTIIIYNLLLALLFGYKFHRITQNVDGSAAFQLDLVKIMIKNTVLAMTVLLSTISVWAILLATDAGSTSMFHLDLFVNCFAIGLLYQYNEEYYLCVCKPCVACGAAMYDQVSPLQLEVARSMSATKKVSNSKPSNTEECSPDP